MYREHLPPPGLSHLVERFWEIRSASRLAGTRWNRVLPDGATDFIIDLGDPAVAVGGAGHGLRRYVVGTMSRAVVVGHAGRPELVGVRFRPGGAVALAGVPAHELADRMVPLEDVLPGGAELAARVEDAAAGSRVRVLAEVLERLRRSAGAPDARVAHATRLIRREGGRITVAALAREVNLGRRQLERLFAREAGESPKQACAVARLQAAAAALRGEAGASLARVAVRAGYHDQAHMTREFRRLAGVTPGAFRRERDVGSVQDEGARVA